MTYQRETNNAALNSAQTNEYDRIDLTTTNALVQNEYNEKYEPLTSLCFCGTIAKGDGGRNAYNYGDTTNRILDREAGGRDTTGTLYYGTGLDQSRNVARLSSWRAMEGQETRTGGMGRTAEKYQPTGVSKKKASITLANDDCDPPKKKASNQRGP